MSLTSLLPIAGVAALAPMARQAAVGLANGFSFLNHMLSPDAPPDSAIEPTPRSLPTADPEEFGDKLLRRLSDLGVDLSTPVRLKSDGRGGVLVDGDHPDRVLIESLFEQDVELADSFHAVTAEFAKSNSADEYFSEDLTLVAKAGGLSFDLG